MLTRLTDTVSRHIAAKLTFTLVVFVAAVLVAASVYVNAALESFAADSLEGRLITAGSLLEAEVRALLRRDAQPTDLYQFAREVHRHTGARFTVIAVDGRVVADSSVEPAELARVENHAARPEVREALAGRPGHGTRTSETVHEPLFYVATPVMDGDRVVAVLRLALPLSVVTASYAALHRVMLVGGLVALAVAFAIGLVVSRRITRPVVEMEETARRMSAGDFEARAPEEPADELGALGRALNAMAERLRDKIGDLEREQIKVRAILDGMVEAVIAVDGHDGMLFVNERARVLFGLGNRDVVGKSLLEVVRNADLHVLAAMARASAPGKPVEREVVAAAEVERILQVNAVPLALGSVVGAVMVLHDVTELRRLERVRTEFVANVSHELRTPLTAIQGYVETLLAGTGGDAEQEHRFLEVVHRHAERLGRLLNDLTDLSNIELGRVSLEIEPTMLDEVLDPTLAVVQPAADARTIAVDADLASDLPAVLADHDRLQQILINLLDNAVKYTPEGGRVSIRARLAGPSRVEVAISDTGVGIPARDLPRVTERFYRVDKARSRELGGTGLGLAIVKHLVQAHGGQLRIVSELGRGTTVSFTLPAALSR
jgi:two-component system, OmpR family, phosphate regulon sensor histidine kinase PhoR